MSDVTRGRSKLKYLFKKKRARGRTPRVLAVFLAILLISTVIISVFSTEKTQAAIAFDANLGQTFSAPGGTTNTHTTTAAAATGSTIILAMRGYSAGSVANITSISGGGLNWTVDKTILYNGVGDKDSLYIASAYAAAGLSSSTVISVTTDAGVVDTLIYVSSFTGVAINNRVDQSNGQWETSSSFSWDSGNVSTTNASDLIFGATFFDLSTTTFTPGGSFNEIHDYTTNGMSIESVYRVVSSTGSYAAIGTADTQASSRRGEAVVAYRAAGGIQTYVDSFTVPAATGNKSIVTGFQPKAILLFANRRVTDGSSSHVINQNTEAPMNILGMATTSSARSTIYTTDDFTSGNPAYTSTQVLHVASPGGDEFVADFVSMDSNGFTLNFTTANVTAYVVNYMAIGGTDVTAAIKSFSSPGSTGNQSQTGVGFQPDAMILIGGIPTPSQTSSRGMGFISGASNQVANSSSYNNSFSGNSRYQRIDKAYVQNSGSSIVNEATLSSFDVDGFTLNYTTATSGSSLSALCLKGVQLKAGSITQKTSTGTQSTTGVGFQPVGLLMSTVAATASTTPTAGGIQIVQAMGASDGTNQAVVNSSGNTNGNTTLDRTKIYKTLVDDASATTEAAASLSSFDSDGFTLNYTTADATAREIIYLAIGFSVNSTPAAPTLIYPNSTATSRLPMFQLRTTDTESDYLKYFIQIYDASNCGGSQVGSDVDQTVSQTGWQGKDAASGVAYIGSSSIGSSTIARYQYSGTRLNSGQTYSWRAKAIDPGGGNSFGSYSSCQDFSTATAFPTNPTVLDDFNRANSGNLGSNWSNDTLGAASSVAFAVDTNRAGNINSPYAEMWWNASTFGAASEAYTTVASLPNGTTPDFGLNVRLQTPGTVGADGYRLKIMPGSSTWSIQILTNGTPADLGATISQGISAGDKIGLKASGSTISAYRYTGGSWALVGSRTDSTYTSGGFIGLYAYNGSGATLGTYFDDFGSGTSGDGTGEVEINGGTTINGGTLIQ